MNWKLSSDGPYLGGDNLEILPRAPVTSSGREDDVNDGDSKVK